MIPTGVIQIRKELCAICADKAHDPCAACDHGHWGQYTSDCEKEKQIGLGDLVASVAQPIARGIDSIFGTNIQNCGGCKKRQQTLNEKFPL